MKAMMLGASAALLLAATAHAQDAGNSEAARADKAAAADASHATDMAMAAFAEGCAPHLDHPQTIRLSMGDVGLKAAPDVVAAQLPHGADDVVWVLPHPGVGVAAVWDMGGAACSVHLQKGDMETLKKAFSALLENTRKDGVSVEKVAPAPVGSAEVLAFEVRAAAPSPLAGVRRYALTIDTSPAPKVQAVLSARLVSGGGSVKP
ncbi:hypothetical protein BH09PSE2_BH09PSE2_12380 [soil metagenome]